MDTVINAFWTIVVVVLAFCGTAYLRGFFYEMYSDLVKRMERERQPENLKIHVEIERDLENFRADDVLQELQVKMCQASRILSHHDTARRDWNNERISDAEYEAVLLKCKEDALALNFIPISPQDSPGVLARLISSLPDSAEKILLDISFRQARREENLGTINFIEYDREISRLIAKASILKAKTQQPA